MPSEASRPAVALHGVTHDIPSFHVPERACDCHTHVFGPPDRYPFSPDRRYMPGRAEVGDLLTLHRGLGIARVVIVQPSPYGTDNRCTIDALRRIGASSRGVAVIGQAVTDRELSAMHEAGVRGVRLNFETLGVHAPRLIAQQLQWTRDRVASLGWHVQMFIGAAILAQLGEEIRRLEIPVVVDHFGGARAELGMKQPGLDVLLDLVRDGLVWVKLSAAQRVSSAPDCADAAELARAFIGANPGRVVWGSDWPHPGRPPGVAPKAHEPEAFMPVNDGRALNRLAEWVDDAGMLRRILVDNPARLYGF